MTVVIAPNPDSESREQRYLDVLNKIIENGMDGLYPSIPELDWWFNFWESRHWTKTFRPDIEINFRRYFFHYIVMRMPENADKNQYKRQQQTNRARYKDEIIAVINELSKE